MAQDLVLAGGKFARPAHLQSAFANDPSNLKVMSVRVPTMSIQGKVFAIQADGKEMRLTREVDGEPVALPSVPVVILGFNSKRGRSYYEGTFDPKNITPPVCWSHDGVAPDPNGSDLQSTKCATCPKAVKGSRISDNNNKQVAACSEFRLISIIPYKALHSDMPPLRLRLPPTSDYDGQNKEAKAQEKFAFSQFIDHIRSRGVAHSYEMVVKMSFDQTQGITYPKLWFQASAWVEPADTARIKELRESGAVDLCLETPEGEVQAANVAASQEAQSAATRAAHAGAGTTAANPAIAAATAKAAEAARKKAEKEAKAAADKAAAEAEAAEAASKAQVGNLSMDLGDDDDGVKSPTSKTSLAATAAATDAKEPPAATHVDDTDVDDIMAQWSGD